MKAIVLAALLLLLKPNISTSFRVYMKRSAEPSVADRNDFSNSVDSSGNPLGIPEDDPDLQNSLQKVMRDMNQKLNRTLHPEDGAKTTQRLKLFFVSPSPDDSAASESSEEASVADYSVADYGSSPTSRQTRGGNFEDTVSDRIETYRTNEETNVEQPVIPYQHPALNEVHSTSYEQGTHVTHGLQYSLSGIGNDTGTLLHNDSHVNDKVEMKVELIIDLSENDQHEHFHFGNHTGITAKNISLGSDHIHVAAKTEEADGNSKAPNQSLKDSDSVLKIAAGNLNLNIKLMSPNHTDTTGHNASDTASDKVPHQQGAARSLNAQDVNKNVEKFTNTEETRIKTHKAKKNVNINDYPMMNSPKYKNSGRVKPPGITSRKVESAELDSTKDDNGPIEPQVPSFEKATTLSPETQPLANAPSTTESTILQVDGNKTEIQENVLSDSLKTIIQNLTKYYANQNGGHPQDGENLIRNISKFLPGNGGTPEEQNYLDQLRKYLSQPNLFDKIGFPKLETLTDFETFLEVLKKLSRSKMVRDSGYYPIISEYINFYDILNPGTESGEESGSDEESWSYESSLVDSLLDYLFDDDSATDNGGKDKSKSQRSDPNDSPESEEWDIL